jgi:hypothetical protein
MTDILHREYHLRPAGRCCDFVVVTAPTRGEALEQLKRTAYADYPDNFPPEWEIFEGVLKRICREDAHNALFGQLSLPHL